MAGRPRNSTKLDTPEHASAIARSGFAGPRSSSEGAAEVIAGLLAGAWPYAHVELDHQNAYQLLVATILSAQSTDKMINTITPALFARYPDAHALARVEPAELEPLIFKSGFYRNKAKALVGMARALVERHGGQVPSTMDALVALPGVARKTANVVLGNALGKAEGVVVDTHVMRLSQRLGLTVHDDPVKIEQDLMRVVPRDQWTSFSNRLIWHGRRVCHAKKPDHDHCVLAPICPSAMMVLAPPRAGATGKRPPTASTNARPEADAKAKAKPKTTANVKAEATAKPKATVTAKPKAKAVPR
jgi:endonuclease III